MIDDPTSTSLDFRDAAFRMVAATEHFKAVGELPTWARTDLASWRASDAVAAELLSLAGEAPPHSAVSPPVARQ